MKPRTEWLYCFECGWSHYHTEEQGGWRCPGCNAIRQLDSRLSKRHANDNIKAVEEGTIMEEGNIALLFIADSINRSQGIAPRWLCLREELQELCIAQAQKAVAEWWSEELASRERRSITGELAMVDGAYRRKLLPGDHAVKVLLCEIAYYVLANMWEEIAEYLDVADEVLYALQEYLAEE